MTADGSAYIVPEDELENDIFVAPRKLRQALHGDLVKVHVYERKKGRKREGEVVEILSRAKTDFTGTIDISNSYAFFLPDDRKMLHDIFHSARQFKRCQGWRESVGEHYRVAEECEESNRTCETCVRKKGENNTEMNAILADFGFPLAFPKEVDKAANAIPDSISAEEIAKRQDFRSTLTFTIDPADAKDFDDALSFKALETETMKWASILPMYPITSRRIPF